MVNAIQLPEFKGAGGEDPEQFWFVLTSLWNAQQVVDDNIKKTILVSALQDRPLTWYIKYPSINPTVGIVDIHIELKKEFRQPKSEAQLVIVFKEITIMPSETPWDLDQRLKRTIFEANMTLMDAQHSTWFFASLTPYLKLALSQQKILTRVEVLEEAMRLHKTPVQDRGLGVQQIQA